MKKGFSDAELLKSIGLSIQDVADALGTDRAVVSRALSLARERRKTKPAKTRTRGGRRHEYYLNLERLLALLKHLIAERNKAAIRAEADRMDAHIAILREAISDRHPGVPEMLRPWLFPAPPVEKAEFSEAWIFSHEPFEVNYPDFRQSMRNHLRSKERRLIYFVPTREVSSKLLGALRAAADGQLPEVYIVVTKGVILSPHWCVLFHSVNKETAEHIVATMPAPREGVQAWRDELVMLPDQCFRDARDALMEAGLLTASDRFRLPPPQGGGKFDFEIFYPNE